MTDYTLTPAEEAWLDSITETDAQRDVRLAEEAQRKRTQEAYWLSPDGWGDLIEQAEKSSRRHADIVAQYGAESGGARRLQERVDYFAVLVQEVAR